MREFVCSDVDYEGKWDGDWFYYPEERMYRRMKDDEMRGRCSGGQLPNPAHLFARRIKRYPQADRKALVPTEATQKLWDHWNARR